MRTRITVCCLLLALPSLPALARKSPPPAAPAVAPSIDLPTRQGAVTSADLAGKLIYVDFWASWCSPCRTSFPWLRALHEQYASKGLVVVAINLDKTRAAADKFLARFPAPFLVAYDPTGKTAEAFHVSTMPSSYLIDPTGAIVYSQAGFDPKETGKIESLIKEALPQ